jgi:hypothetical protein
MKRALLAATTSAVIAGSACGLAYAQLRIDHRQDRSPVVSDVRPPTAVPGPPVPSRDRQLPGYPIDRLEKLREANK